jgi:hypothetical protein
MIGKSNESASPTVVFICDTESVLDLIVPKVAKHTHIREMRFKVMSMLTNDFRLLGSNFNQSVSLPGVPLENHHGLISLCGQRILTHASRRQATIGGVILVDDTYYGLTVAHPFVEDLPLAMSPRKRGHNCRACDSITLMAKRKRTIPKRKTISK